LQRGGWSVTIVVMLAFLTLLALVGLVFFWARRRAKKRSSGAARAPSGVDAWVSREVSAIVAKKLALAKDDVQKTFGGDPDPETVTSIERAVAKVELVFEKLAAGETELRAEIAFEDGTAQRATRTVGWSELPDNVREELARTGASRVHRDWALPWQ
jgi:hypothetical protein